MCHRGTSIRLSSIVPLILLSQLPTPDLEVLSAGITALGGQWRTALTKDVTHLFAITNTSTKYSTALHYQEHTQVRVLLPHWFDDAVRLGLGTLDVKPYEWPDPPLLRSDPGEEDEAAREKKLGGKLDAEKKTLFKTVLWSPESGTPMPNTNKNGVLKVKNVWDGRRVLLSPSLQLRVGMREAVEMGIERAGGVVVKLEKKGGNGDVKEETEKVEDCDVLVTRWRSGKAYVRVCFVFSIVEIRSLMVRACACRRSVRGRPSEPLAGFSMYSLQECFQGLWTSCFTILYLNGRFTGSRHM